MDNDVKTLTTRSQGGRGGGHWHGQGGGGGPGYEGWGHPPSSQGGRGGWAGQVTDGYLSNVEGDGSVLIYSHLSGRWSWWRTWVTFRWSGCQAQVRAKQNERLDELRIHVILQPLVCLRFIRLFISAKPLCNGQAAVLALKKYLNRQEVVHWPSFYLGTHKHLSQVELGLSQEL